jgi:uncharacterized damage-inducible protein DinB
MINMQPEQGAFLLQMELAVLKNEHGATMRVIQAIPENHGDYKPEPLAKTGMELAWHIAATEKRLLTGVVNGGFDFSPMPRPDTIHNPAEIASWYSETFAEIFGKLSKLSGEQAVKIVDFRGMFQLPAVSFVGFACRNTIHHRGQLSTYLRAMGGKVPSIYGESYDSAEAKKAAQATKA